MINMSYCRFHNTKLALRECLDAIDEDRTLSGDEARTGWSMFHMFLQFCYDNAIIDEWDDEAVQEIFDKLDESKE